MFKKTALLASTIFLFSANLTYAHPGRTDASGGHTCRTNCEKWGLNYGEYHYHNGGSSKSSGSSSSINVDTRSPKEKEADGYVWQAEYYQNQQNYYNALFYIGKVYDSGYSYKVSSILNSVAEKVSEEAYSLYLQDDLEKSIQYYTLLTANSRFPFTLTENAKKNIKLIQDKMIFLDKFAGARWYSSQGDYLNATLVANAVIEEGYNNSFALSFMNEVSELLSAKAYQAFTEQNYEYSLKCYTALSYLKNVPAKLKTNGASNMKVVEKYVNK